jgi:glycosyltransferase involved in cell wall biosynthesis
MPVRNGARFVGEAIESLLTQEFTDWRLVISDNASTDDTLEECRKAAGSDPRVEIVRQESDIGAQGNFLRLLEQAQGKFFMWAAADDRWKPRFLSTCIDRLNHYPALGMAFTGIENIDCEGKTVRKFPDLPKLAGPPAFRTVARYLLYREVLGKANLFYSVYRLDLCRSIARSIGLPGCWGGDMAFVLGGIARGGIAIEPEVLFHKRLNEIEVTNTISQAKPALSPYHGIFPPEHFAAYRACLKSAVAATRFSTLTAIVMDYRSQRAKLLDWWTSD